MAAVALMVAVAFVGFVAVGGEESDADTTPAGNATQTNNSVASLTIGGVTTYFDSINDAVKAAQPNASGNVATVTLLKDTTTTGALSFTKAGEYVLDIGKNKLTYGSGSYLVTVGGGSPPVYPIDTINTSAKLTIKGTGTIESTVSAFRSYGTMIFGENGVGPTVSIYNASPKYSIFKVEEGSYLTVNGGTFSLSDKDGNAITRIMQSYGTTVINGGTFNADVELWSWTQGDKDYVSTIEINGGTFYGDLIRGTDETDKSYKLSDDDTFTIKGGSFTDLSSAVKYAKSGATIALADDVTITKQIDVNTSMTIDLNGHTLTATGCHAFNINQDNLTFSINGQKEDSSIIAGNYVVRVSYKSNTTVNITGGHYESGSYAFVLYSEGGQFDMQGVTVNAATSALWVGGKQATKVNIEDSTMTITGQVMSVDGDFPVAVELGTVKEATIKDVTIESTYVGIEIKSGKVTIDGKSSITSGYYNITSQMGSGVNGGSITAVCINNAYYNVGGSTTSPNVTIGDEVVLSNDAEGADYVLIITSGYKIVEGSKVVVDGAPIFVTSSLSVDEVGIVYSDSTTKAATSAITYNGIAYIADHTMYGALSENEKVTGYYFLNGADISVEGSIKPIELAEGAQLSVPSGKSITGTVTGPDGNSVVTNGMKAGEKGITIKGGSLWIDGVIAKDGSTPGVTVKIVSGTEVYISGQLGENVTMQVDAGTTVTIEKGTTFTSSGTITNNGTIINAGEITNSGSIENKSSIVNAGNIVTSSGTVTNSGTLKMTGSSTVTGAIINNAVVADERTSGIAVPIDTSKSTGVVVTETNADAYTDSGVTVIVEDPEKSAQTKGSVSVDTNKYVFAYSITTTGNLVITMNDVSRSYTITIPSGQSISAGTVFTIAFEESKSSSNKFVYDISTPGLTDFNVKLPCAAGFDKAKVTYNNSTSGITDVVYSGGYVSFNTTHNSEYVISLSMSSSGIAGVDDVFDKNTAFIGAIVVLVVAILALAVVIKRN